MYVRHIYFTDHFYIDISIVSRLMFRQNGNFNDIVKEKKKKKESNIFEIDSSFNAI